MSAQYTPGPWSVDPSTHSTAIRDDQGNYLVEMDIGAMDFGFDRAMIDARLIAAAPDLYEALSALLPTLLCGEGWNLPDTEHVSIDVTFGKLKAARAALAKATAA